MHLIWFLCKLNTGLLGRRTVMNRARRPLKIAYSVSWEKLSNFSRWIWKQNLSCWNITILWIPQRIIYHLNSTVAAAVWSCKVVFCVQVNRGSRLVQGSRWDAPETSCCGQRGAGRRTATRSGFTNTVIIQLYSALTPLSAVMMKMWGWTVRWKWGNI